MGFWNEYVLICINIYNFKGIKKYDRFYVFDFNFAKVYSKNMTVFMSLILILRRFNEMDLLSIFKRT